MSLSATLESIATEVSEGEGEITVRQLLALVGEQGLILFIMILTIPFLTPLPLPGISTVFGAIIMLISVGIILNRVPWLPAFLMKRAVKREQLIPVLKRGAALIHRIEGLIRPRLLGLSGSSAVNRLNGLMLFAGGVLLILPLPVLPLSNFLPGWGLLLLGAGILQRDGYFIAVGWVLNIITFLYFAAVAVAVLVAGGSILQLIREPAAATITPTPGVFFDLLRGLLRF